MFENYNPIPDYKHKALELAVKTVIELQLPMSNVIQIAETYLEFLISEYELSEGTE